MFYGRKLGTLLNFIALKFYDLLEIKLPKKYSEGTFPFFKKSVSCSFRKGNITSTDGKWCKIYKPLYMTISWIYQWEKI